MRNRVLSRLTNPLATVFAFSTYLGSIPLANWLIENIGDVQFEGGPHVIPVGFGLEAPSGVLAIGFALVARDVIQNRLGRGPVLLAMTIGVLMSFFVNPDLALASGAAFALGEISDYLVYSPLRNRSLMIAVAASGVVGGVVDSLVFLRIAFGSIEYWQGQVLGKAWMAVLGGLVLTGAQRHRKPHQVLATS
jgi:uncharacterized PurR-regulated membrane protein YhhQ (DUF165 family)